MTYKETCEYLFKQIPSFEHQGTSGYKEGLSNSLALDTHFGHPHHNYKTIHVAGTNGKGSTAHTLAAILQLCGYKTGLYTSPHLTDFSERIRINGHPIDEDYVIDFVQQEKAFFDPLQPTFFELTTAMALKYFSDQEVDIAVIEVGLGGRLDCTNIITPILSVITNISLDHTQLLGSSLEQIAMEKAGIIKKGVRVVIGEATPETRPIFEAIAQEKQAPITFADDEPEVISMEEAANGIRYQTRHYGTLQGELRGFCQEKNTNTVLTAVRQLEDMGYMYRYSNNARSEAKDKEIGEALLCVCELTGLRGRWQVVAENPLIVCDTGHNVGGWEYISRQLQQVKCRKMHIVFGLVDDKDLDGILALLPRNAVYYFTKSSNKRSVSENVLKVYAQQSGLTCESYPSVVLAYQSARKAATADDLVFVGGSSYIVADFLKNCF